MSQGYWNASCVTGDGKYLGAGGDHAVLIELSSGKVVEQLKSRVKAIGCDETSVQVLGYDGAWRLPGKEPLAPAPEPSGDVLAVTPEGAWVSWSRTVTARKWRGPAALFVTSKAETKRLELLPALFGKVGEAKALATPDTFAVRLGTLLDDGRLLAAAGWQPSQNGAAVEAVPWGFFAVSLATGEATPLSLPLPSDPAINQNWVQKIASTPDASDLVIATHDGSHLAVGQYAQGSNAATRVTKLESKGAASAVAIALNGARVAVGSESRGRDSPARAWVLDETGQTVWTSQFDKTIVGLHFLADGALVVTSAEAKAVRVSLPAGAVLWRTP